MALPPPFPQRPNTTIELPAGLSPVYSNLVRIAHSPADLVLDFAHLMPGEARARIVSRVLMSPLSAKLLLRALAENISRYEAAFGEINLPTSNTLAEQLFKPPQQPPDANNPPEEGKP